jgi:hypothetical protein
MGALTEIQVPAGDALPSGADSQRTNSALPGGTGFRGVAFRWVVRCQMVRRRAGPVSRRGSLSGASRPGGTPYRWAGAALDATSSASNDSASLGGGERSPTGVDSRGATGSDSRKFNPCWPTDVGQQGLTRKLDREGPANGRGPVHAGQQVWANKRCPAGSQPGRHSPTGASQQTWVNRRGPTGVDPCAQAGDDSQRAVANARLPTHVDLPSQLPEAGGAARAVRQASANVR